MFRTLAALAWITSIVCGPALAAPPSKPSARETSMRVYLVRSAAPGCEPSCAEWIAAQGFIDSEAVARFKKVLIQLGDRKVPILVDSSGGSVEPAFAIGRLIRAKSLDVVVTKTAFNPCDPGNLACRRKAGGGPLTAVPEPRLSKCASACVFILAGGTRRFVGQMTFVGVHQIKTVQTLTKVLRTYRLTTRREWGVPVQTQKTLVSERRVGEKTVQIPTAQRTYDSIRQFFMEMGISDNIMPLLASASSDDVHWLTRYELQATRIATAFIDGEQLMSGMASSETPCGEFGGVAVACPANAISIDPNRGAPSIMLPSLIPTAPQQ